MVDSKAKKNVQNRNEKNLYIQEWYIQEKNVYGMEMKKKNHKLYINKTNMSREWKWKIIYWYIHKKMFLQNGNESLYRYRTGTFKKKNVCTE